MTRLPETVTSKFNDLFAALHHAADDLKIVGQEAMLSGDFSQVTKGPQNLPLFSVSINCPAHDNIFQ